MSKFVLKLKNYFFLNYKIERKMRKTIPVILHLPHYKISINPKQTREVIPVEKFFEFANAYKLCCNLFR